MADSNPVAFTEITLTFEDDTVTSEWFHPDLSPVMCVLCGKKCQERNEPLCVNANPYCG
jgi:hypothetical protein